MRVGFLRRVSRGTRRTSQREFLHGAAFGSRRGDTLIEVLFAISIFSLVAVISIITMNNGIESAQSVLEVTMARNEIDAQGEALRFIHNSFLSEREYVDSEQVYNAIWKHLTNAHANGGLANSAANVPELTYADCNTPYDSAGANSISSLKSFVINTRKIDPNNLSSTIISASTGKLTATTLYPRIIYTQTGAESVNNSDNDFYSGQNYTEVARAEGIWVTSISGIENTTGIYDGVPEYYDFHIRSCWYSPGASVPSTIGTIVRLYNPELLEAAR